MEELPLKEYKEKKISVMATKSVESEVVPKLRSVAAKRQWIIVLLANLTILSSGMAMGFPAVSLSQLTSKDDPTRLSQGQGSW